MVSLSAPSGRAVDPQTPMPSWQELRRTAQVFLEVDLIPRLGLSAIEMVKGNYLNVLADSPDGRLLIKFYPRPAASKVRRSIIAHGLLDAYGLPTARLCHADDSEASLNRYGLACMATRWVEGTPLAFGDSGTLSRALALLGRIHGIRLDGLAPALIERLEIPASAAQDNTLEIMAPNFDKAVAAVRKEAPSAIRPDESQALRRFLIDWGKVAAQWPLPQVLLHYDFHCSNAIETPDGTIVPIDLESAMFGRFFVDLSRSLFKFAYKPAATELDTMEIEELARADWLDDALRPYLENAIPEAQAFWQKHRDMVIFWGYFRTLRSLVQKAKTQSGLRPFRRSLIRRRLRRRWERMLGFADRAAGRV